MSFKITIERAPIGVEFEVGSISEVIGILEQENSNLLKVVSIADGLSGNDNGETATEATDASKPRKGRKSNAEKAAEAAAQANPPPPVTATAPAPLPVPGTPPAPAPSPSTTGGTDGLDIPDYLKRTANAAPPAAAAPPPPPPPSPPVVPPSGILAGKVIANLDQRKASAPGNDKVLVEWLASPQIGLVNKGVSYDEAIAVVRLLADDKLAAVATALQVA